MIISNKTNTGLVEFAKNAAVEKWGYVLGTWGQILTETIFQQKLRQYPKGVGNFKDFISKNWINRRTADCVGLIKAYLWWDYSNIIYVRGNPIYNKNTDVNETTMFNLAKEKNRIATLPDVPGICVWRTGHIGVYIGAGQVIEAKGTHHGVVITPLHGPGATNWSHWLKCPYIKYEDEKEIFSDVKKDRWSYKHIKKAVELELIKGHPDGTFNPIGYVTREQLAVVSVRIYEKLKEKN